MVRGIELGKWAQDVKLDLIYYFECSSHQWLSSPKPCISQLKSLLCLRKERLCGLNEFQWLNVFACHSGAKSYLMADTQFMAGPPFSQWQVTFVTGKALSEGRAKDRALHSWKEEHKCCAWEMKWEEKKAVDLHSATAQLRVGYSPQPADLAVPDWDFTCSIVSAILEEH